MSVVDVKYKQLSRGVFLIVTADIARGWRRLKNNFGFYGCAKEEYQGDDSLTVRVWVNERPPQLDRTEGAFPLDLESSGLSPSMALGFKLREGCLTIGTYMSNVIQSRRSNDEPGLYEDTIRIAPFGRVIYWLRFFASLKEKNPRPPVWIEHDLLPFPSAGLPELGKRR